MKNEPADAVYIYELTRHARNYAQAAPFCLMANLLSFAKKETV